MMTQRSVSDSHYGATYMRKSQYNDVRDGSNRKTNNSRNSQKRPRDLGVVFGPDEIEIDLNVQDSQMIFEHLAALCKGLKKPEVNKINQKIQAYNVHANEDYAISNCNRNIWKPQYRNSTNKCEPQRPYTCDTQRRTPSNKCDTRRPYTYDAQTQRGSPSSAYKTPTRMSIKLRRTSSQPCSSIQHETNACYSLQLHDICSQSSTKKPLRTKERKKKIKREMKTLRKNCEKKGKNIVQEFKMKEKMRQNEEKLKYKSCKKAFKEEIAERKRTGKERLKRQKERIKRMNKEEKVKLNTLKMKIKRKCKGLKYMVESDDNC